ncbi:hypothetical protein [Lacticaseibacillus sp. GG6-2]
MLITFDEFKAHLKSLGRPVYRDTAPKDAGYPYWVYSFTHTSRVVASGGAQHTLCQYQVSLFTTGTEREIRPFMAEFGDVPFRDFAGQPGSPTAENDTVITNFYTYIEVIADE